jgi:tRNA dimethylallyltransferase
MKAHGVPGFCDHFDGLCELSAAIARAKRDTRRYAKRQLTWIANQFTLWPRLPDERLDVRVRVVSALHAEIDRRPEKR